MSWIKKIFTKFQNDNDDEFTGMDQDQPVSKPLKSEKSEKRDIEAKVLYQYPKGQFRFPLIPDENPASEKTKPRKGRQERASQVDEIKPFIKEQGSLRMTNERQPGSDPFHDPHRDPVVDARSTFKREPNKKQKEASRPNKTEEPAAKFHYETRKDSGPKFRQPFRPTEIPSPIYAFNRPPSKSQTQTNLEDVEFELTGFERSQAGLVEQSSQTDTNRMPQAPAVEAFPDSTTVHNEEQTQEIYIEDDLAETQDFEVPEIEEQAEQWNLESEAIDIILDNEPESSHAISQIEMLTEAGKEPVVKEPEAISYQHDQEQIEVIEPQLEPEDIDFQQVEEVHEVIVFQQTEEISETVDFQQTEESSETIDFQQKEEVLNGHSSYVQTVENQEIEVSYEEPQAEQNLDAEPVEAKPAEPKRQLPFNVLMLKQDKRKWEARNMSKYPSFMTEERKTGASEQSERNKQSDVEEISVIEQDHSSKDVNSSDVQLIQQDEPTMASSSAAPAPVKSEQEEHHSFTQVEPLQTEVHPAAVYDFPPLDLLSPPVFKAPDPEWLSEQEHMLNETLRNFNVGARVVNVTQGPSVTRFEVQPEPGVKVNKITNLSDDIKLSLAAKDIRIEAPIPGKHTIGIEVPNHSSRPVLLSEILQSAGFMDLESPLSVALGLDIAGNPIVTDLKKMPHGLIAGATGSGKSVCINTMLVSLLYKAHPDEVKLLLIDPKMVELAPYNRIPHLVSPVITDVKAATASLKWAVEEMERRYELFAHTGVRDISRFNELAEKHRRFSDKLPYIVIVIDELADLMMMAPGDVEEAICRIAQKARACGIHLIIATQRPSVDVITGLIKANVPTRIAFSVSSQVDSRTIIDISGAEKLLGRGDMLFLENGSSKPFRLQGTFVTDNEIDDIVAFVREQRDPQYLFEQEELLKKAQVTEDEDELFYEACEFVIDQGGASTSSVQRRFKIGYNRAARLIEMMEQQGFISEGKGSKPRDVLITAADLEALQESSAFN
ncbi:FtsK/SpoIIIE domain-containing protein [Mesobacillus subterraneus]|uniref:DNA translocase FtsK n=1 Tax=Mesobacillus subterraneus TaxID=285983 RepID=UPI00203EA9DB|nr:DNA translocase FtsK [Mesobacillus subterraneus]MCM3572238.1 FtsK/SpoIIIE domain-containing protein [Mesobacillus subterraneus]